MAAKQAPSPVRDQLYHSAGLPIRDDPIEVGRVVAVDPHGVAVALPRLGLGQPDPGERRVREYRPRYDRVVHSRSQREERVAHDGAGLVVRHVREAKAARDVAGRIDMPTRGPKRAVDGDPVSAHVDAGRLQPESLDVGEPAGGDEDPLGTHGRRRRRVGRVRGDVRRVGIHGLQMQDRFAIRPLGRYRRVAHMDPDPFAPQKALQLSRHLRVLVRQNATGKLDQGHIHAEPAVRLGELHPDRSSAENHHGPGQRVVLERGFVRVTAGLREAFDRRNGGTAARRDQDSPALQDAIAGLDADR